MDDYVTAWELYKSYGISRQTVYRAIKSGKLNATYETYEENGQKFIKLKWLIQKDEKLLQFLENKKGLI